MSDWYILSSDGIPLARPDKVPPFMAVSALSARRALRAAGLYDQVVSTIAAENDSDLNDAFEYATEWRRDDPWIATVAQSLGLTEAQVDDLFLTARDLAASA